MFAVFKIIGMSKGMVNPENNLSVWTMLHERQKTWWRSMSGAAERGRLETRMTEACVGRRRVVGNNSEDDIELIYFDIHSNTTLSLPVLTFDSISVCSP
jgi:hypothetical protein